MKKPRQVDTEAVTKREPVKVPADVVNDLLGALQRQFCGDVDQKKWFSYERTMLLKAVTYPAWFLNTKSTGTALGWQRYQDIVLGVSNTIKRHGNTAQIGSFGRYFLHAIQTHMEKHWEAYYTEAKRAAPLIEAVMRALPAGSVVVDTTIKDLAALHAAVSVKGGRKKKEKPAPVVTDPQGSLF